MKNPVLSGRALLTVAVCAGLALAAHGGVVYEENFQNYAVTAPNINTNINVYVSNDPIWARGAHLAVSPGEGVSGLLFKESIVLPAGNKFDVSFRYKTSNSKPPKAAVPAKDGKPAEPAVAGDPSFFDLVFRTAAGKEQRIRVAADKVAGFDVAFANNRDWQDFALKANGASADVYYAHDRGMRKLGSVALSGEFATFNLAASAGRHFNLTDIRVQTPGAIPAYPVEKHFASFRSLSQPIADGVVVSAPAGESISLMPTPQAPRKGIRFSLNTTNAVPESALSFCWTGPSRPGASDLVARHPLKVVSRFSGPLFLPVGAYARGQKMPLPDAAIDFTHFLTQSVRPDLQMYCSSYDMEPQGADVLREWNRLPPASRHPLDLDFVLADNGAIQVWVDGSLRATPSRDGASLTNIVLTLPRGARYALRKDAAAKVDKLRYTLLDFSANPRAKAFADAKFAPNSLAAGLRDFGGVPVDVAAPIDSADVAICKQAKGNWALECEEYHGRSPAHGFPSAIHFRLPAAPYCRAHVLFALDPDARKDAFLNLRMGHYNVHGTGGNVLGDTVLDLRGKDPEEAGCKRVGAVMRGNREIPVYLASLDLNLGPVLDLAAGIRYDNFSAGDFIDFEFVGKGWENYEQIDRSIKPDPNSDSSFNIFGATLEKFPAKVAFRQSQPGNVFTVEEKNPKTEFIVAARRDGAKVKVSWTARDAAGAEVFSGEKECAFAKAGVSNAVEIALGAAPGPGYYSLETVFSADGGLSFRHDGAFAILPPARRKVAKRDSPYGTWWFAGTHGGTYSIDIGGPIMQKAGIVHPTQNNQISAETTAKYNLTYAIWTGVNPKVNPDGSLADDTIEEPDPADPTGAKKIKKTCPGEEALTIKLRSTLKGNPDIKTVMLWHESAPGYGIPEELLGLPIPPPNEKDKGFATKVDTCARVVAKLAKELNRELHLQIGNSSASIGSVVRPMRAGAHIESYDRIGIETPSQVIPPERLSEVGFQGLMVTRDVAAYYAKKAGKPTPGFNGCYEFTYRCERDMGERQQAEWYMRDVLISLANGFYHAAPGLLFDVKNGYYNGLWGGSGILRRGPFCYPKQAYVAYAVLTYALDGVTFVRQLDTGSTTVYAIEFKRVDGKTVTALWAARGEADFALSGVKGGTAVHMLGREEKLADGDAAVSGGTSPVYVVTDVPLAGVSIAGRGFARDARLAAGARYAWDAASLPAATLDPDPQMESTHTSFLPILKPGAFTLAEVPIAEGVPTREKVYEVTLDTEAKPNVSRYVTEYTTIRFAEPQPIPGKPAVIGCWVKGNSNWGQIRFEIEDAKGEVFKNLSTGRSWGCDIMDWPGNLAVSFDGWNFVHTALRPTALESDHSPGPVSDQWVSEGGDKKIDLPIKVRAVTVGMNREKLDLLDFKATAPSIRIGAVGGIEE